MNATDLATMSAADILADPDPQRLVDGLINRIHRLEAALDDQLVRAHRAEAATESVYFERAHLSALVAALLAEHAPAVLAYNSTSEPRNWPVLYISLPDIGQICYHVKPDHLWLFEHVEVVAPTSCRARWDRTNKDCHHYRIRAFIQRLTASWSTTAVR
ncbi:hypothetical protein ACIBJI_40215 [Nocardia sp. NPDC050408]|uniref:hypothetical protein n=1 Tax=Nocardia sp. NPDC050408 TaxID=3364319 RepID=UPI0037A25365